MGLVETYIKFIIKAFQRRYRQDLVDGKIDQECLLISQNLIQKLFNKKETFNVYIIFQF